MLARALAAGLGAAALSIGLLAGPAAADPPLTVEDAKAQVAELETEAAAIDQQYLAVKEQIRTERAKLEQKQADVQAQTAKVARMRKQVSQVALAQFQNRTLDTTAQLFLTSETDDFLNQVSTVEKVSQNQNSVLQDFQAERAELATLERSAASDLAALQEQEKSLAALRESSEDKIAQSKALLAKLTEEERKRIEAEEKRLAEEAKREAERTPTSKSSSGSSSSPTATSGSSRGAIALAFAKSQLGKPYRFAAAGPSAYDCSGLTLAAWAKAGVSLPRTSSEQFRIGRAVAKSDLQPGDLVFFYPSDISHVALYAGNGMIINSPRPGKTVEFTKMSYMPYAGARRPA